MFQQLLQQAFNNLHEGKNELALLSIMPIFDKACKNTWPKERVGARFRKGVKETEDIITFIMTGGSAVLRDCTYGNLKLPQITYKYLRNTIIHDGEMPSNVRFVDEPNIKTDKDFVQFPTNFVTGMLIASIGFECYKKESKNITQVGKLSVNNKEIFIKNLVGNHQPVRDVIHEKFKKHNKALKSDS